METTELQIERILAESQVRTNRLSAGFDPISGEGSVGERYRILWFCAIGKVTKMY